VNATVLLLLDRRATTVYSAIDLMCMICCCVYAV
jgi:hypothetical protein